MVKRCIVGGCSNTKREGVSLHSFPTNPGSRKQWIKQIRTTRKDWTEPTSRVTDEIVKLSVVTTSKKTISIPPLN